MSDRDEIDDQAGFLAPLMGHLNEMYPQEIKWGPPPYVTCSGCGKPFEQFRGQFGWQYNSIIVLGQKDVSLRKNENGFPEMYGPVRTEPVRYCSYACADKANPKPTTTT